jgi:hypothetical protein
MEISFTITNQEDIEYLENIHKGKIDDILKSALSIGLRSIQMSEVNLDCSSYLDPLTNIINSSSSLVDSKLELIDDKLNSFLHLQSNSSKKGDLSENICRKLLCKKYPDWEFNDVSNDSYSGDCRAIKTPVGEILYEFKNYDTNVNKEQVLKFHRDLEYTGIKLGIFVSNTSGIVGKKSIEWEIIQKDKIIVYVSNIGYNGYGCIVGTELLVALFNSNILDESRMLFYNNYELNELKENLSALTEKYQLNLEDLTKHKYLIKDQRHKINLCLETLEKSIFDIELNQTTIFKNIFKLIQSIDISDRTIKQISISELDHFTPLIQKISQIFLNQEYTIYSDRKELFFKKNEILLCFTRHKKSKIELIFPINKDSVIINVLYETLKKNEIIIDLKDNNLLLDYLLSKITSF